VEFITLWTFSQSWALKKLTESVLSKRGSSGKAFCYGSIFCGFSYFPIGLGGGFYA